MGGSEIDVYGGKPWGYDKLYDGTVSNDVWSNTCFMTASNTDAWVELYFDGIYEIQSLRILNRGDYGGKFVCIFHKCAFI